MGCGGGVALGVARGVALRGGARRGVVRRGRGAEGSEGPREDRRPARAYEQQAARLSWTRPCVQTRLHVAGRARPRSKTVWVSILVPPISSGVAFGEFGNQPDLSFPSVPMGITLGTTSEGCPEDWRALQSKH